MFKQIRILMANANNNGDLLDGTVEVDEAFIGGKGMNRKFKPHFSMKYQRKLLWEWYSEVEKHI